MCNWYYGSTLSMAICNVFLLRMKLSEAVFATTAMQPGFTLQAHYASVVLANTAAPLITWCTDVSMSIVLHGDWQRSLGTTQAHQVGPACILDFKSGSE